MRELKQRIFRVAKTKDYSVICNQFLLDTRLSWKAKGILAYLLTKPDDWVTYIDEVKNNARDGREATASGFKELKEFGYLKIEKIRENNRIVKTEYLIFERSECPDKSLTPKTRSQANLIQNQSLNPKTLNQGLLVQEKLEQGNPTLLNTETVSSTDIVLSTERPVQFLSYSDHKQFSDSSQNSTSLTQTDYGGASKGKRSKVRVEEAWERFLKYIEGKNFTPSTIERFRNFKVNFEHDQLNIFSDTNKFDRTLLERYSTQHKITVSYQQSFE